MNCPQHIKEMNDPKRIETEKEKERVEDLTALLAGSEDDYDY